MGRRIRSFRFQRRSERKRFHGKCCHCCRSSDAHRGYGGTLRDIPVYRLASVALNEAVKRAHVEPGWVDDVIMGTVLPER